MTEKFFPAVFIDNCIKRALDKSFITRKISDSVSVRKFKIF